MERSIKPFHAIVAFVLSALLATCFVVPFAYAETQSSSVYTVSESAQQADSAASAEGEVVIEDAETPLAQGNANQAASTGWAGTAVFGIVLAIAAGIAIFLAQPMFRHRRARY